MENESSNPSRTKFGWLIERAENGPFWFALWSGVSTGFVGLVSQMTIFGVLNWADILFTACVSGCVAILAITGSLALYRQFKPVPEGYEIKRRLVVGARQSFIEFDVSHARNFRLSLERNGSHMLIRRHLSAEFIRDLDDGRFDGNDAEQQGDRCQLARMYATEIDKLAKKWRIYG